jgi:uncharacterized membrane protein
MVSKKAWDDRDIDLIVAHILRGCVTLAAIVVVAGGIIYLIRHGGATPDYRTFHGEPSELRSVSGILMELFSFRGRGIIQFGLLLLIMTPLTRVVFLLFAFIRQRDKLYIIVSLIVLAALVYSLAGGHVW